MENKKKYFRKFFTFLVIVVISCRQQDEVKQLSRIDELLSIDSIECASKYLSDISLSSLTSQADSAYFYLLQTEINRRRRLPSTSDSAIMYSVRYYKKTTDKHKLSRALYYQGVTTYNRHRIPQTILLIKQAEELAEHTDDLLLKYKICEALTYYNGVAFRDDLYKYYAQKALSIAKTLRSERRQTTVLIELINYYLRNEKKDSALICANECGALLQSMDPRDVPYYYMNLGRAYEKEEPMLAKLFLKKAIDLKGLTVAYGVLANIYLSEDSIEKAKELWKQALQKSDSPYLSPLRVDIFNSMRQQSMKIRDYEYANTLADSVLKWQQIYFQTLEDDKLSEIQAKFNKEVAEKELQNKVYVWGLAIATISSILIIVLGYYSYRGLRTKKALAETAAQLAVYSRKAQELETGGKINEKELQRLNKKIDELQNRHTGILANGKCLYEAIDKGSTTSSWSKNDFTDYIEYYKLRDLAFVNELETEYNHLSAKYMFFAIMEHEGKSDEDIMHILGISESTLRSTRSRINSKRITT